MDATWQFTDYRKVEYQNQAMMCAGKEGYADARG
jgi:hypothetical protein